MCALSLVHVPHCKCLCVCVCVCVGGCLALLASFSLLFHFHIGTDVTLLEAAMCQFQFRVTGHAQGGGFRVT